MQRLRIIHILKIALPLKKCKKSSFKNHRFRGFVASLPLLMRVVLHLRASERGELLFHRCGAYENEERAGIVCSLPFFSFSLSLSFFLSSSLRRFRAFRLPRPPTIRQMVLLNVQYDRHAHQGADWQDGDRAHTHGLKRNGEILLIQYFS